MKKINIAHVVLKGDLTGGPGYSLIEIIENLPKDKFNNIILTHSLGELTTKLKELDSKVLFIKRNEISKINPFPFFYTILKAVYYLKKEKIDISHFQFHTYRDPVLIATQITGIKSIIHFRSPCSNIAKWWLNLANCFIFNSNFSREKSNLSTEQQEKSYVLYNSINIEKFTQVKFDRNKIIDEYNLDPNFKYITCVSRVHPAKKIEYVIEVANVLRDQINIKFLIVGAIQDKNYYKFLTDLIDSYKLQNNIIFLEHIAKIQKIYCITDILIHTAFEEPFGRIFLEASSFKIPVIAFDSGGVSEVLDRNACFLVEYGNINEFSSSLKKLLNSKDLANKISENSYNVINNNFSSKININKLINIYKSLLK